MVYKSSTGGSNSGGGSVNSVTGLNTDNSDAANPIIKISVDNVTVTGLGTPASPLIAPGGGAGTVTTTGTPAAGNLTAFSGSTSITNVNLSGDVTTSGSGTTTLATVNANVGTLGSQTTIPVITTNAKGLITAIGTTSVVASAGTLTGAILGSTVVTSSLSQVGTITAGTWAANFAAVSGANLTNLTAANISAGTAGIDISGNAATATSATTATTAINTTTAPAGTLTGITIGSTVVISSLTKVGTLGSLTVTSTIIGSVNGSASSLATPRAINGVNFDGTAPITVPAAAGSLTGTILGSTIVTSSLTSFGPSIALGTPASGVATNLTGTAAALNIGGNAATVTTNANLTGPITSSGNATAVASQTGTGSIFVMQASPTINTAVLGSSTATTQPPGDSSTKLATTAYVDAAIQGTDAKDACKYASTGVLPSIVYANGSSGVGATLTGVALAAISLDSSSPSVSDRVLIKNQASSFQNGIYSVTATGSGIAVFVLTRTTDFDQSADIDIGDSVFVTAGATLANTTWVQNGTNSPVIGTDPITFSQIAGPGAITSGNGITVTGLSVAIDTSVTVDKTTAQTLTNKTLTAPVMTSPVLGTIASGDATNLTGTAAALSIGGNAATATSSVSAISAPAGTLTGTTIGTSVVVSSLTKLGILGSLTVTSTIIGSVNGSAATLATPRAINGVNFDGSAPITIPAAAGSLTGTTIGTSVVNSSLTSVGSLNGLTMAGTLNVGIWSMPITGNIASSGARVTKAWLTDLDVTNAITGSITGNSATTNALIAGTTTVNVSSATAPSLNQVLTATSPTTATWQTPSGGAPAFSVITGATNTTAAMIVGTGASLTPTGSGNITATVAPANTLTGAILGSTVVTSSLTSVGTLARLVVSGTTTITSSTSGALLVGPNGATNPTLQVDASTASSATGLQIKSAAAGGGVTLSAISSASDETLNFVAKNNGSITLTAGNNIVYGCGSFSEHLFTHGGTAAWTSTSLNQTWFNPNADNNASDIRYLWICNPDQNASLTASTNAIAVKFDMSRNRKHATGNYALQTDIVFTGSSHQFDTGGGTITDVAATYITGAPITGSANATFTNAHSLYIAGTNVNTGAGTVTNSYGLTVNANTGATNNFAARLNGTVNLPTLTASSAVAMDASNNLVSVTNTGTGNNVLANSPVLGAVTATSINFGTSTLSNYAQSFSWTPVPTSLTVVGTPTYTGKYTRIGNMVFCSLNASSTTSTAATSGTTFFTGIPFTPAFDSGTVTAFNQGAGTAITGSGGVYAATSHVNVPTWSAASNIQVNFWYLV